MECIITIEIGTNAVRIIAFDLTGNVIGSSKGSYPTFHVAPDYSEQDPDQMFITMLYVMKNLLNERIHPFHHEVISICFSASMHSVLPIDKHGVALGNAFTWADNRGKNEAEELKNSSVGNSIYDSTGTPIHPMSPLIKIAWLNRNDRDRFNKAAKFITIKTYIIQQLTKDYLLDYSLASATGLLNIHSREWDTDALEYAGIAASRLPDLVPVFQKLNKLRPEYQKSLGLSEGVKILIGSSDGCLATLGGGVWEKDMATITIEDSGAVRVVSKEVLKDSKQRLFNYLLTDKYYISGGPTNNGGVAFEWFAKQFGDFKSLYDVDQVMQQLVQEATKSRAGSDGLLFLPYLLGERAPIWNANARGTFFGINIMHEKRHFIRATIEGILYEIYSIGKTLESHKTISSLTANGSFASIPFCTQLLADIFNKPISIGKNPDSIAQGAYLLAATNLGIFDSISTAAKSVKMATTFDPNKQTNPIYMKYFGLFERLSNKLQDEFADIARLQSDI
ncbi:gluconate kinase, FGGY family [Algoriphagus locisalis]|uniref:Gluconate kinase, FGGY family n=1 Tax=Algoriphagus locisalis TaxID=305507 RepID=A0A1I6YXL4_9BACT|nr:gluconokinase [Algoriphagus locisalis]SFT55280.1 gluconate kinase, FGGY family [Algoriphagus locisalis]